MSNKNIVIGMLGALVVVFGVSYLKPTTVSNTVNVPDVNIPSPIVGANSGSDSSSTYTGNNGVVTQWRSSGFYTATSTLCTFRTGSATSTLAAFTAAPTAATSTTVLVVLENRGSNPFPPSLSAATTTNVFASFIVPAGQVGEFVYQATSTAVYGRNDVFAPGTYVSFYAKNGGNGSIAQNFGTGSAFPSGRCTASFKEI